VALCPGQGGTAADGDRQRGWSASWRAPLLGARAGLVLTRVEPFVPLRGYTSLREPGNKDSAEGGGGKTFHTDGGLVHCFSHRSLKEVPSSKASWRAERLSHACEAFERALSTSLSLDPSEAPRLRLVANYGQSAATRLRHGPREPWGLENEEVPRLMQVELRPASIAGRCVEEVLQAAACASSSEASTMRWETSDGSRLLEVLVPRMEFTHCYPVEGAGATGPPAPCRADWLIVAQLQQLPSLVVDVDLEACGSEVLLEAFELSSEPDLASGGPAAGLRAGLQAVLKTLVGLMEKRYGSLLENAMHRVGWMYGYYLEDNNYDEGTRAIMEGIYEPPQEMQGEMAHPKDDPHQARVDRIAESCGIERIGWIFTTLLLEDDTLLSPEEVLRIAGFQNETSSDQHFTKYRLSKFVSCAVRPDPAQGGQPGINPFMVSEQACAMLRDGILTSTPSDRRCCVVRDAKDKNEIIPEFLVEGKESKKIATDFFVVRVNDTAPKKHVRLFTHAEFPRENRQTHPQRREDLKKYFNKIPKSEPSWSRFADFHLILYIAQEIDVDTAVIIGNCVRDRTEIPEGIMMIINQLIQ
ncbi:unnamed protein product, partial [Polarella glacialis]